MLEQFLRRFLSIFGDPETVAPEDPFVQEDWKPLLLWRFTAAVPGTQVYFTSRPGGLRRVPYESLNLGFHVGDEPEAVRENRSLLCSTLGLDAQEITSPRQRHTTEIAVLEKADTGSGATGEESVIDPCDGVITLLPGTPLIMHFAACVAVGFTAQRGNGQAVPQVHSGG